MDPSGHPSTGAMLQVKQGGEFSGDQERPNGRTRGGLGDRSRRLPAGVYAAAVSGRGGELCPRWAATSWRHPAALRRPGRHSHRQPEPAPPLAPRRQLPRPWARPRSSPRRSHCSTRACLRGRRLRSWTYSLLMGRGPKVPREEPNDLDPRMKQIGRAHV